MPKLFDKVKLKDGTIGTIAEVLEPGVAYLFEYATPNGSSSFEVTTIYHDDIAAII